MAEKQSVNVSTGGSLLMLVFIVLLVLKVNPGGHLDSEVEGWSWWLITAPLWVGTVFVLALGICFGLAYLVVMFIASIQDRYRRTEFAKKRRVAKFEKRLAEKRARFAESRLRK